MRRITNKVRTQPNQTKEQNEIQFDVASTSLILRQVSNFESYKERESAIKRVVGTRIIHNHCVLNIGWCVLKYMEKKKRKERKGQKVFVCPLLKETPTSSLTQKENRREYGKIRTPTPFPPLNWLPTPSNFYLLSLSFPQEKCFFFLMELFWFLRLRANFPHYIILPYTSQVSTSRQLLVVRVSRIQPWALTGMLILSWFWRRCSCSPGSGRSGWVPGPASQLLPVKVPKGLRLRAQDQVLLLRFSCSSKNNTWVASFFSLPLPVTKREAELECFRGVLHVLI